MTQNNNFLPLAHISMESFLFASLAQKYIKSFQKLTSGLVGIGPEGTADSSEKRKLTPNTNFLPVVQVLRGLFCSLN